MTSQATGRWSTNFYLGFRMRLNIVRITVATYISAGCVGVNAQLLPDDRTQLENLFLGPKTNRVWTSSSCDDPNGTFIRYEVLPDKKFILHLKREVFRGPPKVDLSNLTQSGYSTVRKLPSDPANVLISSDISTRRTLPPEQAKTMRGLEERASGTMRLPLNVTPNRIEIVDFFMADPQDVHQKAPLKQVIKDGVWIEGPRKGSSSSPTTACE